MNLKVLFSIFQQLQLMTTGTLNSSLFPLVKYYYENTTSCPPPRTPTQVSVYVTLVWFDAENPLTSSPSLQACRLLRCSRHLHSLVRVLKACSGAAV